MCPCFANHALVIRPIDCSKGIQPLTARSVTLQDDLTEELGADQGAEADGADAADDDDNAGEQG